VKADSVWLKDQRKPLYDEKISRTLWLYKDIRPSSCFLIGIRLRGGIGSFSDLRNGPSRACIKSLEKCQQGYASWLSIHETHPRHEAYPIYSAHGRGSPHVVPDEACWRLYCIRIQAQ